MTILNQILAANNWQVGVNDNFLAVSPAALFGKKNSTSTGLTLGYYGGILDGVSYSDGTHLLTASTTRYVVAARATGVVSSATSTTNWNDSTNYLRMGIAVVGTGSFTWTDWRQAYGAAASGGSVAGSDKQIQYNASGSFGAEAGFEYDYSANTLSVVNITLTGLLATAASASGGAGLRIPHGAAPTSPTNGDLWTTTSGLYARINGSTIGPFATSAGSVAWGGITGTLSSQTDLQAALDAKGAAGIPQNPQSTAYTLVLSDANKHIYHPTSDTTSRVWTIPANASVAFPIGTAVTFDNDIGAGAITIAITSDTLVLIGSVGSTGSRTLAPGGQATAIKVTSTRWRINGVGLT